MTKATLILGTAAAPIINNVAALAAAEFLRTGADQDHVLFQAGEQISAAAGGDDELTEELTTCLLEAFEAAVCPRGSAADAVA